MHPMALSPFRRLANGGRLIDSEPVGDRPKRREGVLAQEAQGQTVLLRMDDGGYYALDEVGARIWELCDGERSLDDIVGVLCAEFDAPADLIRSDVVEFVDDLRQEDLLRI